MNRSQAVSAIKLRLGFYTKKDDEIISELTISQGQLERGVLRPTGGIFKPWFLVSEVQSAVTQIDEDRVPFPQAIADQHNGFLSEVENAALWILDPEAESDDPWVQLDKKPFDEIQEKYPGTDMPKAYDIMGVYFRLRPIPDAEYTLKIITHNADITLASDGSTNKWLTWAPDVLWAHTGMTIATALKNASALKQFTDTFNAGVESLYLATEERLHVNRRYVMGGDD